MFFSLCYVCIKITKITVILASLILNVLLPLCFAGKSLVWVAILGMVVFYIYALISFALLRSSFDPESQMFCETLWQCTVTVIRYGLIGDIFEVS